MRSRTLQRRASLQIRPTSPFHFDGTFHKSSHFPAPLQIWETGRFWQALRVGRRLLGVRIDDSRTNSEPRLRVSVFDTRDVSQSDLDSLRSELEWRFDLKTDLPRFGHLPPKAPPSHPLFPHPRHLPD